MVYDTVHDQISMHITSVEYITYMYYSTFYYEQVTLLIKTVIETHYINIIT